MPYKAIAIDIILLKNDDVHVIVIVNISGICIMSRCSNDTLCRERGFAKIFIPHNTAGGVRCINRNNIQITICVKIRSV